MVEKKKKKRGKEIVTWIESKGKEEDTSLNVSHGVKEIESGIDDISPSVHSYTRLQLGVVLESTKSIPIAYVIFTLE